jgi:GT2 family glycosyltransferase
MKPSNVSVVLLNWNGLEDTLECLGSLEKLRHPVLEVIVVDNGSENGEAEAIREAFPDAVLLPQSENLGFCGGCNVGIRHAVANGADYVLLLNNDTLAPPELIDRLLDAASRLGDVAAISPIILEYPDKDKVWFSRADWSAERAQFSLVGAGQDFSRLSQLDPYESEFACGCCMLIPVANIQKIGLLDERYFAFYEEAAWCAKAKRHGLTSYTAPSAVMYHKVSRSTPSLVSKYLLTRNRLLWMKENLSLKLRLRSLKYLFVEFAWHTRNLFGREGGQFTRTESNVVVRGYLDYFRGRFYKWSPATEELLFGRGSVDTAK